MFYGCTELYLLDLSSWDLSNKFITLSGVSNIIVTNMLYGCIKLYCIVTPNEFDSTNTFQDELYSRFLVLNALDGSKVNPSIKIKPNTPYFTKPLRWSNNLENSCYWSYKDNVLTIYGDEINNKANNATELRNQFKLNSTTLVEPSKITKVEIVGGSIKFVEDTNLSELFYKFYNCESFNGLENLDVFNVTNISWIFYGCSKLTLLDLSNWNIANVTSTSNMLNGLTNLETIVTPYQLDNSNLFQDEFTTSLKDSNLKECDTRKLIDESTVIKPSFIYTNNERLITETQNLCGNVVNVLN